ncbi:hypothetical protein LDENG_00210760, partial [Lucifuga dentata]
YFVSTFPSLASFPRVLAPPTEDTRKSSEDRGAEEGRFKRNDTSSLLKHHVKRRDVTQLISLELLCFSF